MQNKRRKTQEEGINRTDENYGHRRSMEIYKKRNGKTESDG